MSASCEGPLVAPVQSLEMYKFLLEERERAPKHQARSESKVRGRRELRTMKQATIMRFQVLCDFPIVVPYDSSVS